MKSKTSSFLVATFLCALFVGITAFTSPTYFQMNSRTNDIDTTLFQKVASSELVNVYAEKVIYHDIKGKFILKFLIENLSVKTIGVDLSKKSSIYPNQWGIYEIGAIEVISVKRIIPDKKLKKKDMLYKYKNYELDMIQPNRQLAYFVEWNGSMDIEMDSLPKNHCLKIKMDGQLSICNGEKSEHLINNKFNDLVLDTIINRRFYRTINQIVID